MASHTVPSSLCSPFEGKEDDRECEDAISGSRERERERQRKDDGKGPLLWEDGKRRMGQFIFQGQGRDRGEDEKQQQQKKINSKKEGMPLGKKDRAERRE